MSRTKRSFDALAAAAGSLMLAVGRLAAARERGEAIHIETGIDRCWDELHRFDAALAAHAEAWRRGDAG